MLDIGCGAFFKLRTKEIFVLKIGIHKGLIESFFSLSVLNGMNAVLPLVALPYILRVVGAENYGIYAYVYVLIQYLLQLNTYGFNFSATKQIAQNKNDKHRINNIYNSVIACRLILFVVGVVIIAVLSPLLLDSNTKILMLVMGLGVVFGDIFNPVWLFQGMEKMRYMTIVNIVSKSIFTVLIFVIIRTKEDFIYILLLNSLGFMMAGLLSSMIAKKQFGIKFYLPKKQDIAFQFREGLAIFGTTAGTSLYGNANVFILSFFVNDAAVGIYAVAEKIIAGLQGLLSPIYQALFPHISNEFKEKTLDYKIGKIRKIVITLFFVLIIPSAAVFFASDLIINIFCGPGYESGTVLLRIMSPVLIIGALNYTMGFVGMVNLNRQKYFFYGVVIAGVSSVLFLLGTVFQSGLYAGGMARLFSEIVLLMCCVLSFMKIKRESR